jgi:hypothetical protein
MAGAEDGRMEERIGLREVIDQLREEIGFLTQTAKGEALRFEVESIDVELRVGVTKEAKGDAKAKFVVFGIGAEVGGGGSVGTERTQVIKLKLKPRPDGGGKTLIDKDD